MRVSFIRSCMIALIWALALVGQGLCAQAAPDPSLCDNIFVGTSMEGTTTVSNKNEEPIEFTLRIVRSICTSAQCTYTSTYSDVVLDAGEDADFEFIPDTLIVPCLDIFCCGTGSRGTSRAVVTVSGEGCQVQAEPVSWNTCGKIK